MSELRVRKTEKVRWFRPQTSDLRPHSIPVVNKEQFLVPLHSDFHGEAFYLVIVVVSFNEFN